MDALGAHRKFRMLATNLWIAENYVTPSVGPNANRAGTERYLRALAIVRHHAAHPTSHGSSLFGARRYKPSLHQRFSCGLLHCNANAITLG